MSTLSFVALSLQTTHLDPSTVSKASYVKLVDGNITRKDAITVIPPGRETEVPAPEGVPWQDALAQLSMIIGKLPIVSYYRDADKEIFQAASRQVGETPPTFHWLDGRALARKQFPELPDFQLSSVLRHLDLETDYADSGAVEQTAHIVLALARQQQTTSLSELWGELYDQPDDLLDLESTLENLDPEPAPPNEQQSEPLPTADDPAATNAVDEDHTASEQSAVDAAVQQEPSEVTDDASEHIAVGLDEDREDADESVSQDDDQHASVVNEEHPTSAAGGHDDDQQVPAFLLQPDSAPSIEDQPEHEIQDELSAAEESESTDDEPSEPVAHEAAGVEEPSQATTAEPDEPEVVPAASPQTAAEVEAIPATPEARESVAPSPPPRQHGSGASRFFGSLGVVVFGILTLAGVVITVMASSLFFTANGLLLETKIAGVILTAALTLLSLLMTVISYRSARRKG